MSGEGKVGFFSGYKPVGAVLDDVSQSSNTAAGAYGIIS